MKIDQKSAMIKYHRRRNISLRRTSSGDLGGFDRYVIVTLLGVDDWLMLTILLSFWTLEDAYSTHTFLFAHLKPSGTGCDSIIQYGITQVLVYQTGDNAVIEKSDGLSHLSFGVVSMSFHDYTPNSNCKVGCRYGLRASSAR